jgi:hypothetical protein
LATDLTGGIDPKREYVFAERPDDPEMRESVSFWVSDDRGAVGLTRVGIEAMAGNWDAHGLQVNAAFPDGRVYRLRQDGKTWPPVGASGRPTVLGAGPLGFECVEPFRIWRMTFNGAAVQTSSSDLAQGKKDGPLVDVEFEVEAEMAVPPWIQGALDAQSRSQLESSIEGDLMTRDRYEQLFRCTGFVRVGGRAEHRFTGTGLRIRRQGIRRLAGFWGHCWQSALFPSGKAFGCMAYPPRSDGKPTFNEGFLFSGDGDLVPARFAQAPWLRKLQPLHEDVSLVLETPHGRVSIEGETILSTYDIHHDDKTFSHQSLKQEMPVFPALQQAGVRYRWDGEETFGMLERSSPLDQISR